MGMLLLVHLSSSEIMSCKECGQRFATADALRKHKKLGKEEREPQNKRLCHTKDWTSEAEKTGRKRKT
jgi:ribosome-binding protein aMBF1 (putative translation factor)